MANIVVFVVMFPLVLLEQIYVDVGWIVVFVLVVAVVVVAFVVTIQSFYLHRLFTFEGFGELL